MPDDATAQQPVEDRLNQAADLAPETIDGANLWALLTEAAAEIRRLRGEVSMLDLLLATANANFTASEQTVQTLMDENRALRRASRGRFIADL